MKAYITKQSDYTKNLPHTKNNTASDIRDIKTLEDLHAIYNEFNEDLLISFGVNMIVIIVADEDF